MELDDLKQNWKQSAIKKTKNTDIMNLIQHKSYGPVAALKRAFRKQMVLMILLPVMLLLTNSDDISRPLTSVMFWSYVAFCIAAIVFAYYNYRIADKMGIMDGMVRSNLDQQISLLERSLRWDAIALRIVLLFFIILAETVPYFQHYRMLDKWHSLDPFIRFGSYAALFILQYFVGKSFRERKFGRHLAYLKELTKEME